MPYNSTFSGLNTSLRGLLAHQAAMDVTGHNIANLNTQGYSRQRAELTPTTPLDTPAFNATEPGQIGTGVQVARFERLRDAYIDRNLRQQFGFAGSADTTVGALDQIEAAFNEPSDSSIGALYQKYFSALEDVAAHPDDMSARQTFAAAADALATGFNRLDSELTAISDQSSARMANTVTEIDSISARIARLNTQIRDANYAGMQPNDLLDERDRLMDQLAGKINFTYTENPNTQEVTITFPVAGPVPGPPVNRMLVDPTSVPNGWNNITQADLDTSYAQGLLTSGTAFADQQLVNTTIPGYVAQLDALVNDFVTNINAAHNAGFDLAGAAGTDIFAGTTAGTITLAGPPTILANPGRIAAASSWGGAGEPGNGDNAAGMLGNMVRGMAQPGLGNVTWEGFYGQIVSLVGTDSAAAQQDLKNRALLVETLEGRRAEVSGVSLDEEMSNMLRFQHAYNASARVMTAVDEALDTLINRMGRVGL